MTPNLDLVRTFAGALDHDDFALAGTMLTGDCVYAAPAGLVAGRAAILASYAAAAGRAAGVLDEVSNTSHVVDSGGGRFVIQYTDALRAGRLRHTYRCEQHVEVGDGRIRRIEHVELDGERKPLEIFLARVARRVAVVLYPGCIVYEVMLAIELVGEHVRLDVLTPDGEPLELGTGLGMMADGAFSTATHERVAGVLIPGGDPWALVGSVALSTWLRKVADVGAILGAICAGPLVLGQAGLLQGRRFTHGYGDAHEAELAKFWTGASYVDAPLVEDGPLLTAHPQAHIGFGVRFAERIGVLDANAAARAEAFYLGKRRSRG